METKERILSAVIEMLKTQSEETITMRGIAQKVGITLSVINYHFQSKQVLIETAIKRMISAQLAYVEKEIQEMEGIPLIDKVTRVWNMIGNFMVRESKFARISMLSDFRSEEDTLDNSLQVHMCLKELIMKETKLPLDEKDVHLMLHQMGSALQVMFLRAKVIKAQYHIDYFDDQERKKTIDQMVKTIFANRI